LDEVFEYRPEVRVGLFGLALAVEHGQELLGCGGRVLEGVDQEGLFFFEGEVGRWAAAVGNAGSLEVVNCSYFALDELQKESGEHLD